VDTDDATLITESNYPNQIATGLLQYGRELAHPGADRLRYGEPPDDYPATSDRSVA